MKNSQTLDMRIDLLWKLLRKQIIQRSFVQKEHQGDLSGHKKKLRTDKTDSGNSPS